MAKYYEVRAQWNHPTLGWIGPDSAALINKMEPSEIKHAIAQGYLVERDAPGVSAAEIAEDAPVGTVKKGGRS